MRGLAEPSSPHPLLQNPPVQIPQPSQGLVLGSGSEFISGSTLCSRIFSQLGKPCQKCSSRLLGFQGNVIGEQAKVELLELGFGFVAGAGFSPFLQIPGCKLNKLLSLSFLKESLGSWPRARQTRRTCVTCLQSMTPCSQCPLSSTCSASSCPAHRDRALGCSGLAAAHSLLSFSCSPSPASGLHFGNSMYLDFFCYAPSASGASAKDFFSSGGMRCSSEPRRGALAARGKG